ncbi:CIC11C00000005888 [Sungouiella intermedia]|uniref:CIC11C00000005888 n=1 Tax=Sungouiella intermedia TaxID=45354 RepID=A0A1L0BKH6_9ASCO|nr:CIC11C00000005888 [[Candida] intermedia]
MRTEIINAKGSICKKVVYELSDPANLPWMRDIRVIEWENEYLEVEPPCLTIVRLGRSVLHQLRNCGVLDGYDSDRHALTHLVSYVCKLEMYLDDGGQSYVILLELSYRLRTPTITCVRGLSQTDMVNYLYDRIVAGGHSYASAEMKMKYLLVLHKVVCSINGLQVPI